jgi:hypothetical protein
MSSHRRRLEEELAIIAHLILVTAVIEEPLRRVYRLTPPPYVKT